MFNNLIKYNTNKWPLFFDDFSKDLDTFRKSFDELTGDMHLKFPPYNIRVTKNSDNKDVHQIELALAGYDQSDIDIAIEKGSIVVSGKKQTEESENNDHFVFRGIAGRSFKRTFNIDSDVLESAKNDIKANLKNGILTISIPDNRTQKKIEIESEQKSEKILLTESE